MAPTGLVKVVLHIKPHVEARQVNCKIKGGLITYALVEDGAVLNDHDEQADYINILVNNPTQANPPSSNGNDCKKKKGPGMLMAKQFHRLEEDIEAAKVREAEMTAREIRNPSVTAKESSDLVVVKVNLHPDESPMATKLPYRETRMDVREINKALDENRYDGTKMEEKEHNAQEEITQEELIGLEGQFFEVIDGGNIVGDDTYDGETLLIAIPEEACHEFEQVETDAEMTECEEPENTQDNIQDTTSTQTKSELAEEENNQLMSSPVVKIEFIENEADNSNPVERRHTRSSSSKNIIMITQQDTTKSNTSDRKNSCSRKRKQGEDDADWTIDAEKLKAEEILSEMKRTKRERPKKEKTPFQRKNNPTVASDVVTEVKISGLSIYVCNLCGFHLNMPVHVYDHVIKAHAIKDSIMSQMGLFHKESPRKILCDAAQMLIDMAKSSEEISTDADKKDDTVKKSLNFDSSDLGSEESTHHANKSNNVSESSKPIQSSPLGRKTDSDMKQKSTDSKESNSDDQENNADDSIAENKQESTITITPSTIATQYSIYPRDLLENCVRNNFVLSNTETKASYVCSYCHYQGPMEGDQIYELLNHVRLKHQKIIEHTVCHECMVYFPTSHFLKHHMDTVHDKIALGKKVFLQHGESTMSCPVCNKSFRSTKKFEEHMVNTHSITHTFKCTMPRCVSAFSSEGGLQRHILRVHQPKKESRDENCVCELCGFTSMAKQGVDKHQARNCPGTMPPDVENMGIACPNCDRHFPSQKVLTLHVREFHSGPFNCPYDGCRKVYKEATTLNNHISRIHLDKYHCVCDLCGSKLSDKSSLKLHVKTVHKNIKDIICPWKGCGQKFGRKNSLENHYRKHTGDRKFACQYCNYRGNQRASLNYHMKKNHPNEKYDK